MATGISYPALVALVRVFLNLERERLSDLTSVHFFIVETSSASVGEVFTFSALWLLEIEEHVQREQVIHTIRCGFPVDELIKVAHLGFAVVQ